MNRFEGCGYEKAWSMAEKAEKKLTESGIFSLMEKTALMNQRKVLRAFQDHRVELRHFYPSTGYGYDDLGRDTLDKVFAQVFSAEAALVRHQIVNGNHALALALYGILRPGDTLLSVTGKPYDTLDQIIGLGEDRDEGSLKQMGIRYEEIGMLPDGQIDLDRILQRISEGPVKVVYLQRSKGYNWRRSLGSQDLRQAAEVIHQADPRVILMVDNCYGEFTEEIEPTEVGINLVAGSLIKNPGGSLAPTGGYIAGDSSLVEKVSYRMTTPGIGAEVGSYAAGYQSFYQGLFLAPHVVLQSLKTAALLACILEELGYEANPKWNEKRTCIIQAFQLKESRKLISFCKAVQANSPVDSHVVPEPWPMPGYQNDVIMAAGTFVQGASIELSADGPMIPPYTVYVQGGITYEHGKLAAIGIADSLLSSPEESGVR